VAARAVELLGIEPDHQVPEHPTGRNMSEAGAGLESDNADADPPAIWGRLYERGWETERWPLAQSYRAHPRLYQECSTGTQ
jgi:hypothetical protein